MTKVMGKDFVDNFLSAFVHGIYAGDVHQLDWAASGPWNDITRYPTETGRDRFMFASFLQHAMYTSGHREQMRGIIAGERSYGKDSMESFVFYLKEGMGLLTTALESELRMSPQSEIKLNTRIEKIELDKDDQGTVYFKDEDGKSNLKQHDTIISAMPKRHMLPLLDPPLPIESGDPSFPTHVDVGTVTCFWKDQQVIPYEGFGYVIAQSCPPEKNPHGALGVIFDSSARPTQDTAQGDKVTVMLGGHYWDKNGTKGRSPQKTEEELTNEALETLRIHLGITEPPTFVKATYNRDAIAQPTVDCLADLVKHRSYVQEYVDTNRFHTIGQPDIGPGVLDCFDAAGFASAAIFSMRIETLNGDLKPSRSIDAAS